MGNYVFTTRRAARRRLRRRRRREQRARHRRQHRPGAGRARRGGRLRLQHERGARRERRGPRLLARRRRARHLLRRAHGPDLAGTRLQSLQLRLADLHLAPATAAGQVRVRRQDQPGQALDSMVLRPGCIVVGGTVRRSVLSAQVSRRTRRAGRRLGAAGRRARSAAARSSATRSSTRTSTSRRARRSASTPKTTARASPFGRRHRRGCEGRSACAGGARLRVRVALLSREYPPEIYGGAGVHVEYLARELGARRRARACIALATGRATDPVRARLPAVAALMATRRSLRRCARCPVDLLMAAGVRGRRARAHPHLVREPCGTPGQADVRHAARGDVHTSSRCGRGRPSSWAAATRCPALRADGDEAADAVIAVSAGMRDDILRLLSDRRPGARPRHLQRHRPRRNSARSGHRRARAPRHRSRPAVRGVRRPRHPPEGHRATCWRRRRDFDPAAQLVLCAGAPDTPEIGAEVGGRRRARCRPARRGRLDREDAPAPS